MACRISELVLDARNPERLAAFWCEVLGFVKLDRSKGSIEIGPPEGGFGGLQPTIVLGPSAEPKNAKLRLHFDVNPTDRDQDAELARLLALGARPGRELEFLAADVGLPVRHQPGQRLVQRLQRAVPRRVPEHVPGPVDARSDTADGVLTRGLRVLGPAILPGARQAPGARRPFFARDRDVRSLAGVAVSRSRPARAASAGLSRAR